MNNCTRRFLALNCILHGHSMLEAYDNDFDKAAAQLTGGNGDVLKTLLTRLEGLQNSKSYFEDKNPLLLPIVNYLRSNDYAFVFVPGTGPIFISMLAASDRKGEVSTAVRDAVLSSLIKDVVNVELDKDIAIKDGTLYLPQARMKELKQTIGEAYTCYCKGPFGQGGYCDRLLAQRMALCLSGYKNLSVNVFLTCVKEMIKRGLPPTDYAKSTLCIPDYLVVYKETGTIMSKSPTGEELLWLLDIEGLDKGKVVTVDRAMVRGLLVSSMRDLSNIDYVVGGENGGIHVKS